jgi:single-strand DNA-binding protein
MINSVSLTGRLTKAPELKFTANGIAVATFTLAVNRMIKKEEGKQDVDFLNCVAWRGTAEIMANHLHKGSLIGVEGRLQSRTYTVTDNGKERTAYVTEVMINDFCFLESKKEEASQHQQYQRN